MKNVLIITNFNAGRKRALKYKKTVLDFLIKRCKMFKFITVDELDKIDINIYDTLIAMGGDGTVHKAAQYIINTNKTLGIIPCGTANLLAENLGISHNLNKSLNIIGEEKTTKIDILKINEENCILRCGIGYDADIITKTPQSLKNKFGYFAYFIAGIIFALRLKSKAYIITVNNKQYSVKASCIIIANAANMYKNLVSVGQNSTLNDGFFDIFILKTSNPFLFFIEFLKILFNMKNNSISQPFKIDNLKNSLTPTDNHNFLFEQNKNTYAIYFKSNNIKISNNWTNCHIDGEKKKLKGDIKVNILSNPINVYAKK